MFSFVVFFHNTGRLKIFFIFNIITEEIKIFEKYLGLRTRLRIQVNNVRDTNSENYHLRNFRTEYPDTNKTFITIGMGFC